ncbi:T9SS type A sorting domain-containing protein [Caldithrix abyssi]|nr:T9SS type A sorting domain-containing protein [Caldithrix abyssi]
MKKYVNVFVKRSMAMLFVIAFLFCPNQILQGQVSEGGDPHSFSAFLPGNIHTVNMAAVDVAALLAEDEAEAREGVPFRFGYPFEVDLGLNNAGTWTELPNGDRIWRLRIIAPGARSINLLYDDFWLPKGARFFIYNADRSIVNGAFTVANNKEHGKFSTAPVKGPISILEYYEPAYVQGAGRLHISRVVHAYKEFALPPGEEEPPPPSSSCNNNVNCPGYELWENEKQAVVMILTAGGTRICSGVMINNVKQDLEPYLLTANHCLGSEATWIIMFNYESPDCSDSEGPTNQTTSGTMLKASNSASDFALLHLYIPPPRRYNVRYAGWSNIDTAPQSSVSIHHPNGKIKKLADDWDSAISASFGTTIANSHWKVDFNVGTVEHGSSGAPLFDQNRRIAGQLHGTTNPLFTGNNYCEITDAEYGKFSLSWNSGSSSSTRLKEWLDPNDTGATILNGMNDPRPYPATDLYITGDIGGLPTVHWTASPSSVSYYELYRSDSNTPWTLITTTSGTSWMDSGITIETSNGTDLYVYKVMAMGTNGWMSEPSSLAYTGGKPFDPYPSGRVGNSDITETAVPETFSLTPNYPNPFNPTTIIKYSLPEASAVSLVVYDLKGNEITKWTQNNAPAGYRRQTWNGKDRHGHSVPAGVYIYKLTAKSTESGQVFTESRKMILLK